jgi:hypothetical protein
VDNGNYSAASPSAAACGGSSSSLRVQQCSCAGRSPCAAGGADPGTGQYMPEPITMANVNTPHSSRPRGYDDLKTRLQKLQDSPSFAVSAAPSATPPQAERSVQYNRTPSSAGMARSETVRLRQARARRGRHLVCGRLTRLPFAALPRASASGPAFISPVSLYAEVADVVDESLNGSAMKSARPSGGAGALHLAPTPGPSQTAPTSSAGMSSPVTAKGLEVLEETEGILGAVSALPPAEQVPVLERRLRASAMMFDQVVQENMKLAKDRELAQQEAELAKELLQRQQGLPPDVISENSPVANRQELSLMREQMSATCQELIAARKVQKEKDAEIRDLKGELASDRKRMEDAAKAEVAVLEQQIQTLREDVARTSDYNTIKMDVVTLTHEKNLLMSQLDKAQNDIVDLRVKVAGAERVAALGEAAMAERDEFKAECTELKASNTRMGEKIAELATRNSDLDQQNATMRQVVLQSEVDMSQLKKTIAELESIVEKLERLNKEQEDQFLAQLDEATKALEESQERLRELNEKWEQLLAEKEYLQGRMQKLTFEMEEIKVKNATLARQNHKLSIELPKAFMVEVATLKEQSQEARAVRDKQVRLLQRRLEKRDNEIFHLRSVWRAMLTS